jgi:hypothetical protein
MVATASRRAASGTSLRDCYAHISGELRYEHRMKTTITTLVLLGCAFFLGACAHEEPVHTHTTATTTSTGYSK